MKSIQTSISAGKLLPYLLGLTMLTAIAELFTPAFHGTSRRRCSDSSCDDEPRIILRRCSTTFAFRQMSQQPQNQKRLYCPFFFFSGFQPPNRFHPLFRLSPSWFPVFHGKPGFLPGIPPRASPIPPQK